ncbi:hypothetical protein RF11_03840 [Thelohanellus kitauei]|uniref:FLYWCH-type domain-containing protein n=1 Tax=Thelohanellus kitauei TaxID=669202 RepID=A0A0C2MXM4_THEKT|nr:hypothetical protein RF11_03840 [Thelohanellus kitauei]
MTIINLAIFKSSKSKDFLVHENFLFRVGRSTGYILWRCTSKTCPASLTTNVEKTAILRESTPQNHAPNPEEIERKKLLDTFRNSVKTTSYKPRLLIAECLANCPKDVPPLMQSYSSLQRNAHLIDRCKMAPWGCHRPNLILKSLNAFLCPTEKSVFFTMTAVIRLESE